MKAERWGEIKPILAAILETEPADRTEALERLCGDDAALRREVEAFLAHEKRAGADLNTAVVPGALLRLDLETSPEAIGPYRVLRELGRGGMGVVYLGERADGEYRKQVAIKLITSVHNWTSNRAASDPLGMERRFRRERQILAQFEHPGIARMLDGGATAEGQPYFVMEHVEGLPLLEYCDARHLPVAARLTLFLSICDAVAHAHRRLIVHRDLKPGNILVTPDGVAKLLDFGLARVLNPENDTDHDAADITQAAPMMTPAYASPEQIRGELYSVSGDVYSLGVIFYELLSSQRPYQLPTASLAEIVRVVCEQAPAPLSRAPISDAAAANRSMRPDRLLRRLEGDLEQIAAKALEKDPGQRYASVDDFAADVRRHLTGVPVRARPATFAYRAAKLFQRHRVAIPAGLLAAVLILTFAGAAWWEAVRAQRRFEQVRSLAHSVMFDLHDAISPLPGSTAARKLLVSSALQYLEQLSREAGGDPKLAREVALGYERIGMVQGFGPESNLGQTREAGESFRKALDMLDHLGAATSADPDFRRDYLRLTREMAVGYSGGGDYKNAAKLGERNVTLAEATLRAHPSDPVALQDVAAAHYLLADLLTDQGRYEEAIPLRQRALDAFQRVSAAKPGSAELQRSLALAHKKLAALYGVTKRYQESLAEYQQARAIDEQRLGLNPAGARTKLDLSYDYSDLGWVTSRLGDDRAALEWHRRALALRTEAAKADPNDVRAATAVASTTGRIATVLRRLGEFDAAESELRRDLALWKELSDKLPGDVGTATNLADAHAEIAKLNSDMAALKSTPAAQRSGLLAIAAREFELARSGYANLHDRGVLGKADEHYIADYAALAQTARSGK
jgi:serine/threonine protein kinase